MSILDALFRYHPPLNVAHRGARSLAPENTLAAALAGLAVGADMWEMDVRLTADGRAMVFHDETLERTTNAADLSEFRDRLQRPFEQFTIEELRRLDCGARFAATDPFGLIAAGDVSAELIRDYQGEPIPTLAEALTLTVARDWLINVEIKDHHGLPGHDVIVDVVLAEIEETGAAGRVLVSSFNPDYVRQVKERNPELPTALIVEDPPEDLDALLDEVSPTAYHPAAWVVTDEEIAKLKKRGLPVNVWGVNAEKDMRRLIAAGAAGIITDFPQVLRRIIAERR